MLLFTMYDKKLCEPDDLLLDADTIMAVMTFTNKRKTRLALLFTDDGRVWCVHDENRSAQRRVAIARGGWLESEDDSGADNARVSPRRPPSGKPPTLARV